MLNTLMIFIALAASASVHAADLTGTGPDATLQIKILEISGTRPETKDKLYVKAQFYRDGEQFEIPCRRGFRVGQNLKEISLFCRERLSSEEGQEDELFAFDIIWAAWGPRRGYLIENIRLDGTGAVLGDHAEVLLGPDWNDRIVHKDSVRLSLSSSRRISAFTASQHMINSAIDLIGRYVLIVKYEAALRAPITEIFGTIDADFVAKTFAKLDISQWPEFGIQQMGPTQVPLFDKTDKVVRSTSQIREDLIKGLNIN